MASINSVLEPTIFTDAVGTFRANQGMNAFENRFFDYPALEAFVASTNQLIPESEIKRLKTSIARPITIPVLKRSTITLKDGRTCVIGGTEAESSETPVTFSTKGFEVAVRQNEYVDNYIGAQTRLAHQMRAGFEELYEWLEAQCIAYLEANKSTTANLAAVRGFTVGTNAYEIDSTYKAYSSLGILMEKNRLGRQGFFDVANVEAELLLNEMSTYGTANQQNIAQFVNRFGRQFYTNFITPADGVDSTHYIFKPGDVGLYHYVSINARNRQPGLLQGERWYTMLDPKYNAFELSVHYQPACQDVDAGLYDGEPSYLDKWEITGDFSWLKAYSSVSGESPIIKLNLTTPDGEV